VKIEVEPFDGCSVIHLDGEFDAYDCDRFLKQVDTLAQAGNVRVVVDMHAVTFVNSQGLGALLQTAKRLASEGGKLVIANPSAFCAKEFDLIGLRKAVPIHATEEEARADVLEAAEGGAS
jgi:anti-anti-sigma factor